MSGGGSKTNDDDSSGSSCCSGGSMKQETIQWWKKQATGKRKEGAESKHASMQAVHVLKDPFHQKVAMETRNMPPVRPN
ncbi:hypothetical protein NC653_007884 [Populus alba x Populus x berolinensis]|uniref:Uncharacterized protein n=1 Tax=Populus alba x Populus x berolinensis TaxID=444605 RepID=A0AAD6W9B5_9ROSI|nr:hypothetical protein NC653_007884 [Populus alba x Populus x berolinensis]